MNNGNHEQKGATNIIASRNVVDTVAHTTMIGITWVYKKPMFSCWQRARVYKQLLQFCCWKGTRHCKKPCVFVVGGRQWFTQLLAFFMSELLPTDSWAKFCCDRLVRGYR